MAQEAYIRSLKDRKGKIIYPESLMQAIYDLDSGKYLKQYIDDLANRGCIFGGVITEEINPNNYPAYNTFYVIPIVDYDFNPVPGITASKKTFSILIANVEDGLQWSIVPVVSIHSSGITQTTDSYQYNPMVGNYPLYLQDWETSPSKSVGLIDLITWCLSNSTASSFNLILNDTRPITDVGNPLDNVFRLAGTSYDAYPNKLVNVTARITDVGGTKKVVFGDMMFDFTLNFNNVSEEILTLLRDRIDSSIDRSFRIKFDFNNIDRADPNISFNVHIDNTRDNSVEYKIDDINNILNTEHVEGDDRVYAVEIVFTYEQYNHPSYQYVSSTQPVEITYTNEYVYSSEILIHSNAIIG